MRQERRDHRRASERVSTIIGGETLGATVGVAVALCVAAGASAVEAGGETIWTGPDGGAFDAPRNWTDGVPGPSDTALFLSPGTTTVAVTGFAEAHRVLVRGGDVTFAIADLLTANSTSAVSHSIGVADVAGAVASMTVAGGPMHGGHVILGAGASAHGTLVVEDDGWLSLAGSLVAGANAHGAVTVRGLLHALTLEVAKNLNGHGLLVIDGGAVNLDLLATVAGAGAAALEIVDGGSLVAPELIAALGVDAVGSVVVTGSDSTMVVTDNLRVAHAGTGALSILDGATVTVGDGMIVAAAPGTSFPPYQWPATGALTIDGAGSRLEVDGTLTLGSGFADIEIVAGGAIAVGGDLIVNFPQRKSLAFELVGSAVGDDPLIFVAGDVSLGTPSAQSYELTVTIDPDDPVTRGSAFTLIDAASIALPEELLPPALPPTMPPGSEPMLVTIGIVESNGRERLVVSFVGDPDLDGDGLVDGADLGALLAAWGPCPEPDNCPADLNGDGVVDGGDLGILLSFWLSSGSMP